MFKKIPLCIFVFISTQAMATVPPCSADLVANAIAGETRCQTTGTISVKLGKYGSWGMPLNKPGIDYADRAFKPAIFKKVKTNIKYGNDTATGWMEENSKITFIESYRYMDGQPSVKVGCENDGAALPTLEQMKVLESAGFREMLVNTRLLWLTQNPYDKNELELLGLIWTSTIDEVKGRAHVMNADGAFYDLIYKSTVHTPACDEYLGCPPAYSEQTKGIGICVLDAEIE